MPNATPLPKPVTLEATMHLSSPSGMPPYEYKLNFSPVDKRQVQRLLGEHGYGFAVTITLTEVHS